MYISLKRHTLGRENEGASQQHMIREISMDHKVGKVDTWM